MEKQHVVCPSCGAINRISEEKRADNPKCGKCANVLFSGQPFEVSQALFQKYLDKNDIPVVVDFWASWCGPCKTMAPAYAQAAGLIEPDVRLIKVNTEHAQQLAAQYNIRSIPTIALFKNGKEVDRIAGAMDTNSLVSWVKSRI